MTSSRFVRLTVVTILVGESLLISGLHFNFLFFVIFLVAMNLYNWFDHKLFG